MGLSKAALPALQIPEGFWADLAGLVLPILTYAGVQILRYVVDSLHLDQKLRQVLEKFRETWVGHLLRSWLSSFLSDVAKTIGDGGPDAAVASRTELQRSLVELETRINSSSPESLELRLISQLKAAIDHEVQKGLSREG